MLRKIRMQSIHGATRPKPWPFKPAYCQEKSSINLFADLQRHSGRSRESCWRFVLQTGLKIRDEHRRWTEDELDTLREHIATHSVEETAKVLGAKREVSSLRASTK